MKVGSSTSGIPGLATLFRDGTVAGLSDGQLLERFVSGPGEAADRAFEAMVERHGSMVLGVCRRSLGNPHDAEDAAQATFLVLARRARSIRKLESVTSWLVGVAIRLATRARVDAARRRVRDRRAAEFVQGSARDDRGAEAWPELHEAIARLPEKYRLAIVLCYFEQMSHEQAAERMGCPVRTVQTRMARARDRLRNRLSDRGLEVLASGPIFGHSPAMAAPWKRATVEAAVRFSSGPSRVAPISPVVDALARGALNTMMIHNLKWAATALLVLGVAATGLETLAWHRPPNPVQPDEPVQVKLIDGTTIEVVAISSQPSGPMSWWRPDGTVMAEPPVDLIGGVIDDDGSVTRTILARVSQVPEGSTVKWNLRQARSYTGGRPTKDGVRVPGLEYYVASFDPNQTSCELQVRVASGPWLAEGSHTGTGGYSFHHNGHKFYFGKARPHQGGTAISVANNIVGQDTRLVAVDLAGKVHLAHYSSGGGGEILSLLDAEFSPPPDQIRRYQVESRPFETQVIPGIPLRPHH